MANAETLPLLLKQLGLPMILENWESVEQTSQKEKWRYAQYLATLCELESANRCQRRIVRHTKEAKLPPGKTLATFDFSKTPSISKDIILSLADNTSWVKQANNFVIFGPSGVGKSHLAAAITYRLIEQGIRALFVSTTLLVQKLQVAKEQHLLPEALNKLARIPLLILDDIAYVKKNEMETSVLFELIADRYENSSLIITANQPFGEWDSIFPDNMMAVAAIDRIVHHATILNITEESYRKAQASSKNNNVL